MAHQVESAITKVAEAATDSAKCRRFLLELKPQPLTQRPWLGIVRHTEKINPKVRKYLREVVNGRMPWPVTLVGGPGAGKTCAGLCAVDVYGGWVTTCAELISDMLAARRGDLFQESLAGCWRVNERTLWKDFGKRRLVFLDELGEKGTTTEFQYEVIKRAIDVRERTGKPTILATSRTLNQLAQIYDEPLISRIEAGTTIQMPLEDLRTGDRR